VSLAVGALLLGGLYVAVPQLEAVRGSWGDIERGERWWLAVALAAEAVSLAGYLGVFHRVLARGAGRLTWAASYQITMASLAATRLLAAGGAGGIALTAWALRRAGLPARVVSARVVCQLVLLYGAYVGAMGLAGLGLRTGVLPGPAPAGVTVVPAALAGAAILTFAVLALLSARVERLLRRWARGRGRRAAWAGRLAAGPDALRAGTRMALALVRSGDPALAATLAWWAGQVLVLWACLRAFGVEVTPAVATVSYFLGMVGNLLPLPGGIGGVDGATIGALLAFGVAAGPAVLAVLAYRIVTFWLPTAPGVLAYLQLRRSMGAWERARAATS
jgi:uncharacterized protein (TIRG00374 family)